MDIKMEKYNHVNTINNLYREYAALISSGSVPPVPISGVRLTVKWGFNGCKLLNWLCLLDKERKIK
jgi:hypothetical protein